MIPNTHATPHVPGTSLRSDSERTAIVAADSIDRAVRGTQRSVGRVASRD
ncbi:MAG: hypothetical protein QUV35_17160 [Hydrogenophaga sp.]|nr:hypothetical protein [Hydrogenophaga sp.]MDM7944352.1 hypothetical protein [Hydrogenophaga sp.]